MQVRADITKELITERGFNAVCAEAGKLCTAAANVTMPSPG